MSLEDINVLFSVLTFSKKIPNTPIIFQSLFFNCEKNWQVNQPLKKKLNRKNVSRNVHVVWLDIKGTRVPQSVDGGDPRGDILNWVTVAPISKLNNRSSVASSIRRQVSKNMMYYMSLFPTSVQEWRSLTRLFWATSEKPLVWLGYQSNRGQQQSKNIYASVDYCVQSWRKDRTECHIGSLRLTNPCKM